ncbi:hypothetical protein ACF0H5_001889 [Mactra antiquata]
MMTLYECIIRMKMKTVGAVVFIRLLLLIAGVESNPGPNEILVFRLQYLLVEVGTKLLRKVFDDEVNNNFMQYLRTHPDIQKELGNYPQYMQKLLPPQDNNPYPDKFDISLLARLLRDMYYFQNNPNIDEIRRLAECRNDLQHMATVYVQKTDFNRTWYILHDLLHKLNRKGKNRRLMHDLHTMIDEASNKPLDEELKEKYDKILIQWRESEKGFVDLKIGQSEIKFGQSKLKDGQSEINASQSEIKAAQSELKDGQSEIKKGQGEIIAGLKDLPEIKQSLTNVEKQLQDVQESVAQNKRRIDNVEQSNSSNILGKGLSNDDVKECLSKSYETNFRTLCVTPLYREDDCMEICKIYKQPELKHVPYHRARQKEGNYCISSYKQIFCKGNTLFRNIFVTGNAGMGKTSFGQFMSFLWCKAIAGEIVGNKDVQENAEFMTKFDYVYYISLKETNRKDVVSMIIDKYFYTSSKDTFEETIKTIEDILQTKDCLVILDGLDEWTPANNCNNFPLLPRKVRSDKCIYLTTCRPYKIENVRLSEVDIDHQVEIIGFNFTEYIRDVIDYINKSKQTNKDPEDFLRQVGKCGMSVQLSIPILTSQLILIWFEHEMKNMSKAMIYGSILEMLFERALKNQITFPPIASADVQFPESFSRLIYLRKYVNTLKKVCLLSFLLLFDPDNQTPSLVFTKQQLESEPYCIAHDEVDFLCQLGILSKNKLIASFGRQEQILSFLHMIYLEFLAALYVSLFDKPETVEKKMSSINDISKYKNFLTLMSGISSHTITSVFNSIYTEDKYEIDYYRHRQLSLFDESIVRKYDYPFIDEYSLYSLQDVALSCSEEVSRSNRSSYAYEYIKLEDFFIEKDLDEDLKILLNLNKNNVKFLFTGKYLEEFTVVTGLQYLCCNGYGSELDQLNYLLLQNSLTLHFVRFSGCTLTQELPLRKIIYLTSISLVEMTAKHKVWLGIMGYISGNVELKYIYISDLECSDHGTENEDCRMTLNLSEHSKLDTLGLNSFLLQCIGLNTSSLKSVSLGLHYTYLPSLLDIVNTIKESKLEKLALQKSSGSDEFWKMVTDSIRSLAHITDFQLQNFTLPDSLPLQFHPDIRCDRVVHVALFCCTLSTTSFHDFIDSIIKNKAKVEVTMLSCCL